MTKLAILTPTYKPDLEYFRDLHASVLRHTPSDAIHHAIVPPGDVALFDGLGSSRLKVHRTSDFLPRWFVSGGFMTAPVRRLPQWSSLARARRLAQGELFVNARRPWPPIRGWILQQIVKISAVGAMQADVVLLVDSDVALIRPLHPGDFLREGVVRFYRLADGVTPALPRHMAWHDSARRLLGLPAPPPGARPDYVTSFVAWDPRIVRRLQQRIAAVAGADWTSAVGGETDISEWTIYGTYVDRLGSDRDRSFVTSESLCHYYWDTAPLTSADAESFVASIRADDVAILIQSKSGTPLDVRRRVVEAARQRVERGRGVAVQPPG